MTFGLQKDLTMNRCYSLIQQSTAEPAMVKLLANTIVSSNTYDTMPDLKILGTHIPIIIFVILLSLLSLLKSLKSLKSLKKIDHRHHNPFLLLPQNQLHHHVL